MSVTLLRKLANHLTSLARYLSTLPSVAVVHLQTTQFVICHRVNLQVRIVDTASDLSVHLRDEL